MNSKDIVITAGTALGSVLELAHSIRKEIECKVYVLGSNQKTLECLEKSNIIDEVSLLSSNSEKEYIQQIEQWYDEKFFSEKPILYFTTDTSCFYINNNREWFEKKFLLCLPSSFIVQTFTQKGLAEVEAETSGLLIPKTQVIKDKLDVEKISKNFNFPIIIKPLATYLKEGVDFKIKILENSSDLESFTQEFIYKERPLLCQEFIPGGDEASYYYLFYRSNSGIICENMGQKILQSSSNGGIMAKGLTKYNEDLADLSRNFLKKIDYTGIGGIEFKKYMGKYYFIEMSVRLEGFYKIAEISGIPLALLSYYDLTGNNEKFHVLKEKSSDQRDDCVYIDFLTALMAYKKERRFVPLIKDIFHMLFNKKTKINVYSKGDSKPFWNSLNILFQR